MHKICVLCLVSILVPASSRFVQSRYINEVIFHDFISLHEVNHYYLLKSLWKYNSLFMKHIRANFLKVHLLCRYFWCPNTKFLSSKIFDIISTDTNKVLHYSKLRTRWNVVGIPDGMSGCNQVSKSCNISMGTSRTYISTFMWLHFYDGLYID